MFGLIRKDGPRADEDDADEQGKEKKNREEKGKRRSDERTPNSSSASGPKKSDTGSCKKTRKESQKADGGLVEEATIWDARAENRVDADPKLQQAKGQDLSDESDSGSDGSSSSLSSSAQWTCADGGVPGGCAAARAVAAEGLRVDPANGMAYTRAQFIAFYRGTAQWALAFPAALPKRSGAAGASKAAAGEEKAAAAAAKTPTPTKG